MEFLTPQSFSEIFNVSRETRDHLAIYIDLLKKWQKQINLVGPTTLEDAWRRHILDSAQIYSHLKPANGLVLDLGSGAGFPGLVLSVLGIENIVLIESNQKKCSFLGDVIRQTGSSATVFRGRIEDYPNHAAADYITARALAPLASLLDWSAPLLAPSGKCLFLKGQNYEQELTDSQKKWTMAIKIHASVVDADNSNKDKNSAQSGVLLEIGNLSLRDG